MPSTAGIKAGKAFILIEALDKTGPVLGKIEKQLLSWGRRMESMGKNLMMKALLAFTPTAFAGKTFIEFDDSMRKVEARSHGTGKQMEMIRDQAQKLGRETAFTAGQIGELQAKLAQGGFDRGQILDMTEPIMLLARAAGEGFDLGEDATQASRLVSGIINTFKMDSREAAGVADLLTATINNSNYSLEGLLVSFQYAGNVAAEFNIPLRETLATLGSLSKLQIDPSIIGTAFRNMNLYMSNQKGRDDFNATLKEATGNTIDFVKANGDLRTLPEILFAIGEASKGMGSAAKGDMLGKLFGIRAMVPASALMEGVNPFAALMSHFDEADNLARKTAATMESGAGGAFREFGNAIEGVALTIGKVLEPAFISLSQVVSKTFNDLVHYLETHKYIITNTLLAGVATIGFAASLIVAGKALQYLGIAVGMVRAVFSAFYGGLILLVGGMQALRAIAMINLGSLGMVRAAMIAYTAVVGIARGTIVAYNVVVGLMTSLHYLALNATLTLEMAIYGLVSASMRATLSWALYAAIFAVVISLALGAGAALLRLTSQMGSAGSSKLLSVFKAITDYLNFTKKSFSEVGASITKWFQEVATKGISLGQTLMSTFQGISSAIEMGDTQAAWDVAIAGLTLAWDQFTDILFSTWASFCDFFADAWTGAVATIKTTWSTLQTDIAKGMIDLGWMIDVDAVNAEETDMNKKFMALKLKRMAEGEDVAANEKGAQGFRGTGPDETAYGREVGRMAKENADYIGKVQDAAGKAVAARQKARDEAQAKRDEDIARKKVMLSDQLQDIEDRRAYHRKEYEDNIAKSFEAQAAAFGGQAEELITAGAAQAATPLKANDALIRGTVEAAKQAYENSERTKPMQTEDLLQAQLKVMNKQLSRLEELAGALDAG